MINLDKLAELNDIDLTLLTFDKELLINDKELLKMEYNKILDSLRKSINGNKVLFKYKLENPGDVIHKMIDICGYRPDFAINKSRYRIDFIIPRQYAQTISRYVFKNSNLDYIGSFFVNSDHATVLHSVKTVKNLVQRYKQTRQEFEEIQEKILGFVYIKF